MDKRQKYYSEFSEELKDYKKLTDKQLNECDFDPEKELSRIKQHLNFLSRGNSLPEMFITLGFFVEKLLDEKDFYTTNNLELYNDIFPSWLKTLITLSQI